MYQFWVRDDGIIDDFNACSDMHKILNIDILEQEILFLQLMAQDIISVTTA